MQNSPQSFDLLSLHVHYSLQFETGAHLLDVELSQLLTPAPPGMGLSLKFIYVLSDSRCCYIMSGLLLLTVIFVPTLVGVFVQDSIKPPTVFLKTGGNQSTIVEVRIKNVFILTHHLGMNYYVNFLGCLDDNGFQLI